MKQGVFIEKMKKALFIFGIVTIYFLFSSICSKNTTVFAAKVEGETEIASQSCAIHEGRNLEGQNYTVWSQPIRSSLTPLKDGTLMRVQVVRNSQYILVEYYDANYQVISTKKIPTELPIWGGFFATDSSYYVVTGQTNFEESDTLEVFRITKYDKQWNRIASAGLSNCNTTIPFDAGSCRMDFSGKYLFIRTSHEMYTASDGLNHQANVTIQLDTETMKITDSYTEVMNNRMGYVSHSFNQFVKIENDKMIAVDHGDGHPRSIALFKYQADVSKGTFTPDYFDSPCKVTEILKIPGETGYNRTGASAGAFEISSTHYLLAGNSILQDDQYLNRFTRNIFVASVDKNSSKVQINWITSFQEGEESASTPHMIPVLKDKYLLLWQRQEKVYYTIVDNTGRITTKIYEMDAKLSDCIPVRFGEKIIWYTWDNARITFYEINFQDLSVTEKKTLISGHDHEFETAFAIKIGNTVEGEISEKDCYDMLKFTLSQKQELQVTVSNLGYYSLHFYDEKGNKIKEFLNNDLDILRWEKSRNHNFTLEKGTYYLKIDTIKYVSGEYLTNMSLKGSYQLKIEKKICTHTYQKTIKKASMKKKGSITEKCNKCGVVKKTTTIPAPTKISLSAYTHTYSGKERKPSVTIYDTKGRKLSKKRSYSVSYKHNKYVGKAMVIINFKGNYSGKVIERFPIIPKPTTIKSLQGKERSFTVSWAKVNAQVSGYQIQYSASKKFPKKQMKIATIESNSIFSKTLSTVRSTTYYVRVRTFKRAGSGTYYSKWSEIKQVKT